MIFHPAEVGTIPSVLVRSEGRAPGSVQARPRLPARPARPKTTNPVMPGGPPGPAASGSGHCCGRLVAITGQRRPSRGRCGAEQPVGAGVVPTRRAAAAPGPAGLREQLFSPPRPEPRRPGPASRGLPRFERSSEKMSP